MTSLLTSATARHLAPVRPMRLAMIGTRGDHDGGLVEEVGRRLVARGHHVTAYDRKTNVDPLMEHLSRRALSAAHLTASRVFDVAFVFDAAHAPLVPLIRSRGTAVALQVDSLEATREQRGERGRRTLRRAERRVIRDADALIAGTRSVRDRYADEFGIPAGLIGAGTTILRNTPCDLIEELGLVPGGFHLMATRFEPEDHVDVIVEAYHRSAAHLPLVVVGTSTRFLAHAEGVHALSERDGRIRLLDGVRHARLLDQLYAHAVSSLHGRGVGGAHPSLLRAMGAGTPVLAWDAAANREVAGTGALYFDHTPQLTRQIEEVERYPMRFADLGELMQERAARRHDWNQVTEAYEALAAKLTRAHGTRGISRRPRR